MKHLIFILLLLPAITSGQKSQKKILMIVSSYGKDLGKTRPGFEMDEFSQAYLIFQENGLQIEVASPKGGKVESGSFNKEKEYNNLILKDKKALKLLENTKATSSIKAKDYDAIYIVGGKGPMFDLAVDASLQDILAEFYEQNKVISAVCHGTVAMVHVKVKDKYIIENQKITGYCNEEEKMFGKENSEFPFLLEDKLITRKAKYQKGEAMLPYICISEKIITGQNPYSTTLVAEEVIKSLGLKPIARKLYPDEMSMQLVKRAVAGETDWAKRELLENKDSYDMKLIAIYGYYRCLYAKGNKENIQLGINIMELTIPYYYHKDLQYAYAQSYIDLGDKIKAKEILEKLIQKEPAFEEAKKLMNTL
ncbi:MAG: DJ-1/PfpI family protein [Raineya sp.]|jgi:putative intracellular protease/amidase|nr:DJ-1/PfpI family protein [Raineya sp.]